MDFRCSFHKYLSLQPFYTYVSPDGTNIPRDRRARTCTQLSEGRLQRNTKSPAPPGPAEPRLPLPAAGAPPAQGVIYDRGWGGGDASPCLQIHLKGTHTLLRVALTGYADAFPWGQSGLLSAFKTTSGLEGRVRFLPVTGYCLSCPFRWLLASIGFS